MRLLIAILAVLALIANPVTAAAAAQAACGQGKPAIGIDMAGMDHAAANSPVSDPCCDHGSKTKLSCAQACAAECGVAAVLAMTSPGTPCTFVRTVLSPAHQMAPRPHEPSGLDRPPKSIA